MDRFQDTRSWKEEAPIIISSTNMASWRRIIQLENANPGTGKRKQGKDTVGGAYIPWQINKATDGWFLPLSFIIVHISPSFL
jgi:hypothetical protein